MAIVPNRSVGQDTVLQFHQALVNAAVLVIWCGGAAMFTVVHVAMQATFAPRAAERRRRRPNASSDTDVLMTFFRCLARVLSNSAGPDRCYSHAESLLTFVTTLFAMLTAIVLSSVLFVQIVAEEPPRQMDTIAELEQSNMVVRDCVRVGK